MSRPEARLVKGFRDIRADDLSLRLAMVENIRRVYERYGYQALETPAIEFVDVLGKFLPEANQPDAGVFAFQHKEREDDKQPVWVALRYDLTAPLSRVVAQYGDDLPRPFKRYQVGPVWRMEKPGPGRFREFYQFDFDTVGASSMMADTEVCMVMADALEAVGIPRGDYQVRVNNRKVLNGVLDACGASGPTGARGEGGDKALDILRAIDKLDRVGLDGVVQLLTTGRKDLSGDFTPGCGLTPNQADVVRGYLDNKATTRKAFCERLRGLIGKSKVGEEGVNELAEIDEFLTALGYDEQRVVFDATVVRGLEYYTGPVFEAALTFEITDDDGRKRQFGSVMGGGRYDGLVQRFTGQQVPATGASMGVDRMLAALKASGRTPAGRGSGAKVLVTVMDKSRRVDYQRMAQELRAAGIETELYLGNKKFGDQLKHADKAGIQFVVIAGSNEFDKGVVMLRDMVLGEKLRKQMESRQELIDKQPGQFEIRRGELVAEVKKRLTS